MSSTVKIPDDPQIWHTMPGWGIAADLTPREVVDNRRLRSIRKLVVAALALLLMVCVGSIALSVMHARAAEESLRAAETETNSLVAEQGKYGEVVKVQSDTRAIDSQIASLMKTDVDVAALVLGMRDVLPGTMSITSMNVTMSTAPDTTVVGAGAEGDTKAPVGTVNLAGTSQELADLATFVSNLEGLEGVVDVLPESNATAETGGASWSVTLNLTDELYTHRFDVDTTNKGQSR